MKQLARLSIFIILILVIEFLVMVGFSEWWLLYLGSGWCRPPWAHPLDELYIRFYRLIHLRMCAYSIYIVLGVQFICSTYVQYYTV